MDIQQTLTDEQKRVQCYSTNRLAIAQNASQIQTMTVF